MRQLMFRCLFLIRDYYDLLWICAICVLCMNYKHVTTFARCSRCCDDDISFFSLCLHLLGVLMLEVGLMLVALVQLICVHHHRLDFILQLLALDLYLLLLGMLKNNHV